MATRVYKNSRHVRWNWERSSEDERWVRYHFIVVDDKNREVIMNKIIGQISKIQWIEEVRSVEGKVKGTEFRYLFNSYDSPLAPRELDLTRLNKPIKRDFDLKERKIETIEDHVRRVYE